MNEYKFKREIKEENILIEEALFGLSNGSIGVRGNIEEGYDNSYTMKGVYYNGFANEDAVKHPEKQYGFNTHVETLLNNINTTLVQVYIKGKLVSYKDTSSKREIDLKTGKYERVITGKGYTVKIERIILLSNIDLVAQRVTVKTDDISKIKVITNNDPFVGNYYNPEDPRTKGKPIFLTNPEVTQKENKIIASAENNRNEKMEVISFLNIPNKIDKVNHIVEEETNELTFEKYNYYNSVVKEITFDEIVANNSKKLELLWNEIDTVFEDDEELTEAFRYHMFQMFTNIPEREGVGIAAKGLSGEGYGGHYFWDLETFIIPVLTHHFPEKAKRLLRYRYHTLDKAIQRAKQIGFKEGACYPWRTIKGLESSSNWPYGTAEWHINFNIGFAQIQYYEVNKDKEFFEENSYPILKEIMKFVTQLVDKTRDGYGIFTCTGPDEYTALVNNNYYTNMMCKYTIEFYLKICKELNLEIENKELLEDITNNMILPFDNEIGIPAQDDSFLKKSKLDTSRFELKRPFYKHYHPLIVSRFQISKQADLLQGVINYPQHFIQDKNIDLGKTYNYYEEVCTHDSTLSNSAHSIVGYMVGENEKGTKFLRRSLLIDINNIEKNTKDGLHMANIGATWELIAYGLRKINPLEKQTNRNWKELNVEGIGKIKTRI